MTLAKSGISVRKLSDDELRGRRVAPSAPPKFDVTEHEPEGYGGGAFADVGPIGVVTAPDRSYLAVTTVGSPRTSEDYRVAAEALYAAAFGVKVRNKAAARRGEPGADGAERSDFRMPPLERLRGAADPHTTDWTSWTLLLRRPRWIDEAEFGDVREQLEVSKGIRNLSRVHCLDLAPASYLQTRIDGRWSAALTPTSKAFDVHLREQDLIAADDGAQWHEVCLGEPGAPVGQSSYLLRLRLA